MDEAAGPVVQNMEEIRQEHSESIKEIAKKKKKKNDGGGSLPGAPPTVPAPPTEPHPTGADVMHETEVPATQPRTYAMAASQAEDSDKGQASGPLPSSSSKDDPFKVASHEEAKNTMLQLARGKRRAAAAKQ